MIKLIHDLCNKKPGFGELFADGLVPAAEKIGAEALELAPHLKKLDLLQTAERIFTLQRLVNVKFGIDRKDDKLPAVTFKPSSEGSRAGKYQHDFEAALDRYYVLRGWDENGFPKPEKVAELGIA